MKTLMLIRHAKSSWEVAVADKSRIISARGIENAHTMGAFLAKIVPEFYAIQCSTAVRAKETAQIICAYLPENARAIGYHEDLYTFNALDLERFICRTDNQNDTLILFGHNEAITDFVNKFGSIYIPNVPTAGFVHLEMAIDSWSSLKKGTTVRIQFPNDN